MNGVAQVLSGNPNGVMVLGAGFLQGFMSDIGFAFYGYRKWTLSVIALSGALAPLLHQIPEGYFFGFGHMALSYTLLRLAIRIFRPTVSPIHRGNPNTFASPTPSVL